MSTIRNFLPLALLCWFLVGATAQTTVNNPGKSDFGGLMGSGGVSGADTCRDGDTYVLEVPNLICVERNNPGWLFRPEVINLDRLTIRDVLEATGTDIRCRDKTLIVQAIRVSKTTPYWKCTAFVLGPGSGMNTNFDTGWRYADNTMLDDPVLNRALNIPLNVPALENRALLFSPPNTKYTVKVIYVRRDDTTGRTGAPITVSYILQVKVPTRSEIACTVVYFSKVAAGVTQKPKITDDVVAGLLEALSYPDNISALIWFETIIALASMDFSVLRDFKLNGKYDARWFHGYLLDTDEEPIGCLLIEMATAALWY